MNRSQFQKGIYAFLLILASVGIVMTSIHTKDKEAGNVLRVAFPYSKGAEAYEPARIHLGPEYIFLENVYSPLVEMSSKGEIEPGVAKSYKWVGTDLHLTIRENLKTISGKLITAEDAEFSFKRLLAMPGNTHGDFRELICGKTSLSSSEDLCEGIRVENNELILKTTEAGKTFLLPMLTAIDFAIVPKTSVDPVSMKIINYKDTSGPFYVSQDSALGKIELRANPYHYHFTSKIPQVIELVPSESSNPRSSLDDFKNNRVDFITTIDQARADDVIAFSKSEPDSVLHTTMNIRLFVLGFSDRGMKELTSNERLAVGERLRQAFSKTFSGVNGYESSEQFFPAFSAGGLEKEKMAEIEMKFKSATELPTKALKMTLVRLGDVSKFVEVIKSIFPKIDVSEALNRPDFLKYDSVNEMPHLVISGPDTGFLEDIGLISYSMNSGYFGLTKNERKEWLKNYMKIQDKVARLTLLKSLHEKALSEPFIVPLLTAPYAAVARRPWKVGLSQLYANNQLWLIQKD